jgi:pimeloyl-ACP methyl ester carboxylesterase
MSNSALPSLLLAAALIVPVAMLLACLSPTLLKRMPSSLWIAPVPALVGRSWRTGFCHLRRGTGAGGNRPAPLASGVPVAVDCGDHSRRAYAVGVVELDRCRAKHRMNRCRSTISCMSFKQARACDCIQRFVKLILVSCVAIFAACSINGREGQLPSIVRAERQLKKAERTSSNLPQKTAELLSVARTAAVEIPKDSGETNRQAAISIYDRAAADLATELPELTQLARDHGSRESIILQSKRTGEVYRLQPGRTARGEYSWTYFQKLLNARTLRVRRGEKAVVIPGLGGTVVGVRRSVPPGSPPPRLESAYGFRLPVTSIIDFSSSRPRPGAPLEARLRLVNPRQNDSVQIGGQRFSLAANFSAPLLSYSRLNELWLGLINMIWGGNMRITGLLLTEPYDPDRIPVIFVHGLLSSSYIWRRTALTLIQDPEIRRHYQFWVFSYPTGNPITFSALRLREDLAFAKERFGLRQGIVLIGHSMGGLLCRMQVTNSGRTIWDEVFGPRAQGLYAQVPNNSRVKQALIFQANPVVKRVVFVATPHRGSRLAEGGIAAIAIWLIRLPFDLLHEIPETVAYALNPESRARILPTSVQGLSPNSPLLHALDRLPIEAPHHSIIGDRGRGDTPNSSDGVVPYWSSHLASAQSEMIAPTGHEPMTDPGAVEEIRRILLLNLGIDEHQPTYGAEKKTAEWALSGSIQ